MTELEDIVVVPVADGQAHSVRLEPVPRRVRVDFAGTTVADTDRALYMFETGHLPVYYLPREDVRFDLLEPSPTSTHCPVKGDASYWSVRPLVSAECPAHELDLRIGVS